MNHQYLEALKSFTRVPAVKPASCSPVAVDMTTFLATRLFIKSIFSTPGSIIHILYGLSKKKTIYFAETYSEIQLHHHIKNRYRWGSAEITMPLGGNGLSTPIPINCPSLINPYLNGWIITQRV